MLNTILCQNALDAIPTITPNSVDLILTSPPYAQQRKKHYDSIPENEYPQWTRDWMELCKPILKPNGNIAIIIRTSQRDGAISPYLLKTRLELHNAGWIEPEELIWIKSSAPPLGSKRRPRRAWEHILWFASNKNAYCNTTANGKPSHKLSLEGTKGVGKWIKGTSPHKDGIARSPDHFTVSAGKVDKSTANTHPAQFPEDLAAQIIKMLCPIHGTVLDPFLGSGTTALAAKNNERNYIGIEVKPEYCTIAEQRLL
jgi:site-specific DNA-methyltransferase (adenine-specific)